MDEDFFCFFYKIGQYNFWKGDICTKIDVYIFQFWPEKKIENFTKKVIYVAKNH